MKPFRTSFPWCVHGVAAMIAALAFVTAACSRADRVDEAARADALREELIAMGRTDQQIREGLDVNAMSDTVRLRRMSQIDSTNTARMREIVRDHGWPGKSTVGAEAAKAAFLVVQHSASHEFQTDMLALLRASADRGDAEKGDVAMLMDRVLSHAGKPQLYGTQFQIRDGKLVPYPIDDPARLDQRRITMGLTPMAEYVAMLREAYGGAVEFDTARLGHDTARLGRSR